MALDARAVSKTYGAGPPVLKGIDLRIVSGERVALIGSNGTGKSTLLRATIGLTPMSDGQMTTLGETFRGSPSPAQRARLRRRTGFVFQRHGLVQRLTVLSNVAHGLFGEPGSWRGWNQALALQSWRDRAMAALDDVGLADKGGSRADRLSGGQSQRVAIARALVRGPSLIIADEPAASLDPAAGTDMMTLFADLVRDRGITLIFTSHDMDHAVRFSDRIVALKHGRVLFDRPSAAVCSVDLAGVFDG